jgi:hypothetical protein
MYKKIDGLYGGNAKYIEWIPLWYLKQNVTYKFFLNSTLFLLIANLFSFSLRNIKFDKNNTIIESKIPILLLLL